MKLLDALSPTLFPHTPRPVRLISSLLPIDRAGWTTGWLGTALATGLILLIGQAAPAPAAAQSERGYEAPSSVTQTERGPDAPAGSALPSWAEPQRLSPSPSSPSGDPGLGSPVTANGLGPPDNPNRVPLGGMEWLILAGAGYGAFRLRKAENN